MTKASNPENAKHDIQIVADNQEKFNIYSINFKRYNKAKANEFYFECMWILHAMLEDRSAAFLYHLGFTNKTRHQIVANKKIKPYVRQVFGMAASDTKYKLNNIYGKLSRINDIVWYVKDAEAITDYQKAIKKVIDKLTTKEDFMWALKYLNDEWREVRNQLTHALFNKNTEAVFAKLLLFVEGGYKAIRILDSAVSTLKKEKIRKRFNIQ